MNVMLLIIFYNSKLSLFLKKLVYLIMIAFRKVQNLFFQIKFYLRIYLFNINIVFNEDLVLTCYTFLIDKTFCINL
ncbi:LOW QUALITY PROTEIN: hypothetical protein PNEG_04330 [Pneumocystis murina B123]|uniref:Uncharacterized protein n=1 Tax=Pneumocystis murina (strain B123) TaxID=1069680 RepID=A0A0W4ZWU6_PNEMU|nr:LOW QUALITY PROTEIN: hypothetical protein PNEG_04330 [Pneumocystis murina B123]KTW32854.1 LOW QUALITY PROTEIN: hypothetical protein PNEG_04330 [Pneumocystis murina B123]